MGEIDFNRLTGPQRKILRNALMSVFTRKTLNMFLVDNGFGPLEDIVGPSGFKDQTFELIEHFTSKGDLDNLVERVRTTFAKNADVAELRQRLLFGDADAESQRVVQKAGGLERMVRDAGFRDLNLWTAKLAAAGRRVCRISYPVADTQVRGTGFLVANDLVLTNYHVVEDLFENRADPKDVRLSFGYAETSDGLSAGEEFELADHWIVARAPYSSADLAPDAGLPAEGELDFALLRLAAPAGATAGVAGLRGSFDLHQAPGPTKEDAIVFVLQHPEGKPLKQSIGILKESSTPLRLRYDADTSAGSSGGLVLDQRLAPVALHHAGDPDSKIKAKYNQGIPLTLIRAALEADAEVKRLLERQTASPPAAVEPARVPREESAPKLLDQALQSTPAGNGFTILASELMPQAAELRTAADAMRPFVTNLADEIEVLDAYKRLHDYLQQLEDCYRLVTLDRRYLLKESSRWDSLVVHEVKVDELVEELSKEAEKKPLAAAEARWIKMTTEARDGLKKAVGDSDVAALDAASRLLGRLLARWPSQINTKLVEKAKALGLSTVVNSMAKLSTKAEQAPVDSRVAERFKESVVDLTELDLRLSGLVKRHDGWQQLDDELRRVEADIGRGLEELEIVWGELKTMTLALCGEEEARWAATLNADVSKLEDVLAAKEATTRPAFLRFRSNVTRRFTQVDHDLLEECGNLQRLREDLTQFLEDTL